jgi:predicted AlkP superfamily phosphohydrolase/phosphomutase
MQNNRPGTNNSTKKRNKIIIIGLDACDPDLVQLWSKEGRLPFLSSLMKKGVWARLLSTSDLFSEPWPSFNTGVNPGKHFYYNFLQLRRGTTEIFRAGAYDIPYLPFWSLLQRAGKKIAVFDAPKTYPVQGPNGIQVASWGEHYPLIKGCSLPTSILNEINSRFGKYSPPHEVITPGVSQEKRLYQKMLLNLDKRAKAIRFLMDQEDWDLFLSVFSETHYGGHQLFHLYDQRHWAHDSQRAKLLGDSLPTIYSRIDAALSGLLSGISDETTLFIVSVHGILANYSGYPMLPTVLEKLGFQIPAGNGEVDSSKKQGNLLSTIRDLVPERLREVLNERVLPQSFQDRLFSSMFSSSIDWKRSKAFFLPSDNFQGFISINLKGREPWGTVEPGTEYDQVCNDVRSELMRLVNPDTGKSAIQDVVQVSKIYQGENQWNLPDLVIRWSEDAYIRKLYHPKFGTINDQGFKLRRSQHTAQGFMIAAGKHINPQAVLNIATTLDVAPTILYLMGQPIPEVMDGKILLDLIDEEYRNSNEAKYQNISMSKRAETPIL